MVSSCKKKKAVYLSQKYLDLLKKHFPGQHNYSNAIEQCIKAYDNHYYTIQTKDDDFIETYDQDKIRICISINPMHLELLKKHFPGDRNFSNGIEQCIESYNKYYYNFSQKVNIKIKKTGVNDDKIEISQEN